MCVCVFDARHTVAAIIKIIGCYGMRRQLKSMTVGKNISALCTYTKDVYVCAKHHKNFEMATAVRSASTFSAKICNVSHIYMKHKRISVLCKKNHIAQGHDSSQTYPYIIYFYIVPKNRVVLYYFCFVYVALRTSVYEYHEMI